MRLYLFICHLLNHLCYTYTPIHPPTQQVPQACSSMCIRSSTSCTDPRCTGFCSCPSTLATWPSCAGSSSSCWAPSAGTHRWSSCAASTRTSTSTKNKNKNKTQRKTKQHTTYTSAKRECSFPPPPQFLTNADLKLIINNYCYMHNNTQHIMAVCTETLR